MDHKFQIVFGGRPVTGEDIANQIGTCLTTKRNLGESWDLSDVKENDLLRETKSPATKNNLGRGFVGFSASNSTSGD